MNIKNASLAQVIVLIAIKMAAIYAKAATQRIG